MSRFSAIRIFCLMVLVVFGFGPVATLAQKPSPAKAKTGNWRIRVKENGVYFVTVHAREAPLAQVAEELSQRLKAPIVLSKLMAIQRVTLDFQDLPLENALQLMAPLPYIHYELRGSSTPVCREIFLNGYNEAAPVPKLGNKNIAFVLEGDTEDNVKDDPLRVNYKDGRLSVNVKKQSLSALLDRIANVLRINFALQGDSPETVDIDFKDVPLDQAMTYFPPTVHLHVRKDVQLNSTTPLLLELVSKTD